MFEFLINFFKDKSITLTKDKAKYKLLSFAELFINNLYNPFLEIDIT